MQDNSPGSPFLQGGEDVKTGWQPLGEDRPRVDGIARDVGFRPLFAISAYWHEDSLAKGDKCPVCGNPCCCAATVYLHQSS